jgi:hypothetical protein
MPLTFPSGGMFGIKLVGEPNAEFRFCGKEGNPPLMNFPDSAKGRTIAASVPIGHRSLVYLMAPIKRIWAAVEYIKWDSSIADVLQEGMKAALAQDAVKMMNAVNTHFAKVWRCVRVLAVVDNYKNGPAQDFDFQQGDVMFDMTQEEYLEVFNAMPWTWRGDA